MSNHKRSAQSTRADFVHFVKYSTRWSDNDQYSHINNAVYYQLIDSVINAYLEKHCGLNPSAGETLSSKTNNMPPIGLVVSSHCSFFSPLSFPQTLDVGLRVIRIGRSSVEYEVGIFAAEDDRASAVGGYVHVFVDRTSRRPIEGGFRRDLKKGLDALYMKEGTGLLRGNDAKL